MRDLKRYDMRDTNPGYDPAYRMVADEHGEWVAFEDAEELQTRNDCLALLVRLMANVTPHGAPGVYLKKNGVSVLLNSLLELPCTYTNGIPDLTDDQWERLAKLERGEA